MSDANKAVFLSYTTDDKAVALAVCEALREGGVEVWMDQSELQGGDAWDAHIHQQLRDCALIIPIISARTQARREGYFRLEWRLADERMRLVAEGTPLIVPVVADDTQQKDALVPKSFLTVQWSRLPHGHVPPAFVVRVRRLLGVETSVSLATTPALGTSAELVTVEAVAPIEMAAVRPMERDGGHPAAGRRGLSAIVITAVLTLLVGVPATWFLRPQANIESPKAEARTLVRFAHDLPAGVTFRNAGRSMVAISPDGRSFVYNTTAGLFIRSMDEMNGHLIAGTEAALANPIFSPDSQSVAFFSAGSPGELRRISANGGASVVIGPAANPNGMSWGPDGTILYGQPDGIWRVSALGGTPEKIIPKGEGETLFAPQMLPGGRSVLFSSQKMGGATQVEVASLPGGGRKIVSPGGGHGRFLPATGHLLYLVDNDLFGVAFDLEHMATLGGPVPLVQDVRIGTSGATSANFGVSDDGTLIVLTGIAPQTIPVWVDRQGKEEPVKIVPGHYGSFALSPDGTRLALSEGLGDVTNGGSIFILDLLGETQTRLTLGATGGRIPIWSPDGTRVIYDSLDGRLSVKPVNNTRPAEVFVDSFEGSSSAAQRLTPSFFTPDGRVLVFTFGGGALRDIAMKTVGSPDPPTWLFRTPSFAENEGALSPDGRWMAYTLNESGRTGSRPEVYVSPFPNLQEDRFVISNEGGRAPLWSRDGKELFFVGGRTPNEMLVSATVQAEGARMTVVSRNAVWNRTLRDLRYAAPSSFVKPFDISPDGRRFLVHKEVRSDAAENEPERIFLVQNWTEELKRRVPTARK